MIIIKELLLFTLLLGMIMFCILNFTYFFDWLNLIGIIVKIINPNKQIPEIENNNKIRNDPRYKTHRKKWIKIFFVLPIIYFLVTLTVTLIFKNTFFAFFIGVIVTAVTYSFFIKKETNERKITEKHIHSDTEDIFN